MTSNLPPGVSDADIEAYADDLGFPEWADGKTDRDLLDWLIDERGVTWDDLSKAFRAHGDMLKGFDALVYDQYIAMLSDQAADEDEAASDRERGC